VLPIGTIHSLTYTQQMSGGLTMEQYLMNPVTGSVDIADNWAAEMFTWDDDPAECQRQFNRLIEVVRDANGDWIEIE
jgi:hypothetical protein